MAKQSALRSTKKSAPSQRGGYPGSAPAVTPKRPTSPGASTPANESAQPNGRDKSS